MIGNWHYFFPLQYVEPALRGGSLEMTLRLHGVFYRVKVYNFKMSSTKCGAI